MYPNIIQIGKRKNPNSTYLETKDRPIKATVTQITDKYRYNLSC